MNGDGFDDLIVGADGADPNGSDSGESYVVFGGDFSGAVTQLGPAGADTLTGGAGDDVIIGGLGFQRLDGGSGQDTLRLDATA